MGGGSSSNPAPSTTPTKRGKSTPQAAGVAPVLPAPKCQVEGCGVDLTGAKTYYCRHKVCAAHSKSPKVVVAGKEQRFCQQCSRFHQLNEFDHGKRSCRRRLAGHNERRRKPPPGLPSSQYGHLPYIHEYGSRSQCFVVDFTTPNLPANARPTVGAGNQLPRSQDQVPFNFATPNRGSIQDDYANTYGQGSAGKVVFNDPHLDPHQSLGVTDSNCALSLLSGQPLGTSSLTGQVPVLSQNSSHGFQMSEPSMLTNLVDSCNAHGIPYHMSLGQPSETGYPQFSANFEPAPLVTNQYTDSGYGRTYESSSNLMHNGLYNPRY